MSYIPSDIVRDILLHLPLEDLGRFRCVCKSWQRIINDASFTKLLLQMGGEENLIISNENGNIYIIPLSSLYHNAQRQTITIEAKIVKRPSNLDYFPAAFCDGLVLVFRHNIWALWNPLTAEYRNLPLPPYCNDDEKEGWDSAGLGYDSVTDDYKVVRVYSHRINNMVTMIYSLKSDKWHIIDDYPNYPRVNGRDPGVFVNGAINWLTYRKQQGVWEDLIIALDLSTEKYRHISVPSISTASHYGCYLSVLNGCLVFSCKYDAWILNDYGGEEIWTKFLPVGNTLIHFGFNTRLLAYVKSKEQVLIQNRETGFGGVIYKLDSWRKLPSRVQGLGYHFCMVAFLRECSPLV